MKALGLFVNLSFYSSKVRIGDSGRMRVERIIRGARRVVGFKCPNCHLIFMLFVDGNIVRDVEYVRRI